ncbi:MULTISPECIES: methionine gamma-lyase family protein [Lysinibacillus]|uniref:methionine gamma-lyase family protein n=1 Tax=Lysinibacillus TaxID=400634 RepID=UPI0021A75586|nr:methionine gamma-lyase family protein [Lysinibacillus capsici]MCT1540858.1 methionine gamma-lyase family protein [Lysinibacillus capsici]MCT1572072.1 methionine gamma-lyase family protein [Lysinibacillus capsici]MCT1649237.1 methionine gamma-lyase family protein [Lysinibacillus capsici]MCT1727716.1 methionine gamma-lyase family protein [Lysinibacillus capsici]MCT1785232.1 methionine gamma-lyase family protein [Lysinibacillus capsici]
MTFTSNLSTETLLLAAKVEEQVRPYHANVEEMAFYNQQKVLAAFRKHQVSDYHLHPSNGYGYDDEGRDNLERVYAEVFGAEAAIVRPQIISGTHAITLSLFGVLRPGDELLYISGQPYDTLQSIVDGGDKDTGSLKDYKIGYRHVDLLDNQVIDWAGVEAAITAQTKMIAIQRSKGYATRPSFTIEEIAEMCVKVRKIAPKAIIFVDNCYGEFVEAQEPTEVGADLMAGSLIKNPGGGLAKIGGYIAGRADLVEKCAYRMTSPGIGAEAGATLNTLGDFYQGFFLAPHVVSQALKGAIFTASMLEEIGISTSPSYHAKRTDLIQSVSFQTAQQMIDFCREIQANSPINAHYAPEPAYMPGYEDDVIMAAGTFIQGSSIELTADGPIRPPYTAFIQGGLTYEHVKFAICSAVQAIQKA